MKVCLGSKNPAKIKGVKTAFEKFFQQEIELVSVDVESGLASQPYGDETQIGAINRAKNASKEVNADFYVGVEAGIFEREKTFVSNWICIFDGKDFYLGMSPWFELNKKFVRAIKEHKEMEEVMEKELNIKEIGDKSGSIGVFTRGAMDRAKLTEVGVLSALAGWEQRNLKF